MRESHGSISEISRILGKDQKTVSKYIKSHGIKGVKKRKGGKHLIYSVWDVAHAMIAPQEGEVPEKAYEKNQHYQAELKRLEVEQLKGNLCETSDVRETYAGLLKTISQTVSVYPDIAERDKGASKEEVLMMENLCDHLLKQIHEDLERVCAGE